MANSTGNSSSGTYPASDLNPSVPGADSGSVNVFQNSKQILDIDKNLSALFIQQVKATPNALALEDDTTSLTYAELDDQVATLARRIRSCGVVRDSLVGVLFGRSADYVIACLAALRAGGAFLVLEAAYPPGLLKDVIDDAKPVAILTHKERAASIQANVPVILLDEEEVATEELRASDYVKAWPFLTNEGDLERLSFVCYTSGTTGRPKGICNPHRAPVRSYDLRFRLSDLGPGDRVACNAFFIWEMLRPLLRGATAVAVPDEASYDPVALVDLLSSKNITETLMTPTLLSTVLARHTNLKNRLPNLRTLWLNGEVVSTDLAQRGVNALPNTRLLNCYSASETHEIACGDIRDMLASIDKKALHCPVGHSVDPSHTYVLDTNGQRVAEGEVGELFIGGKLLAHGYLNLPDVTAASFRQDTFTSIPGAVMYRTGDEARILPNGMLEISGRVGGMLKVRGYSVVPGKVESTISKLLAVSHCAVVAQGDGLERQLVAYFVRDVDEPGYRHIIEVSEYGYSPGARRALASALAQYQIPALWVELPALPTHDVSGKIDLKRLPPPTRPASPRPEEISGGSNGDGVSERAVAEVWAAALKVPLSAVTSEHDFFDLGGHSLSLATLANRLSSRFGCQIALGQLAGSPTLTGHVKVIRDVLDGQTAAVQADLPRILREDAMLPEDLRPKIAIPKALNDAQTVLLTGSSGFLGAFILDELIRSTSAHILCLVRFGDPTEDAQAAAVARVRRNLLDLGLWHDAILDRIEILPGDVSKARLGLSEEDFTDLASRVQVIIHAAAQVNLVYPYAALRKANVGGTLEVLRLACQSGATVQYISTNGVLQPSQKSWPEASNLPLEDVLTKLLDGYGQTKWAAEQLVFQAGQRGLPVKIHRLGTLGGHSTSGSTNVSDLFTALLVESLRIGHAPKVENWRAEVTPVDYVSKAIVSLANNVETRQVVFHLGDANPPQTGELFEIFRQLGYPTRPIPWEDWTGLWKKERGSAKGGDGAYTVDILRGGMPSLEWIENPIILGDEMSKGALSELQRPSIDSRLLETYARHWYARGWLPRQPLRKELTVQLPSKSPLHGKVAIVTGASSGIGAAVAVALAREGAHVVLAARRTSELETVKNQCKQTSTGSSKILLHPTDVTDASNVKSLVKATRDNLGPVDILVSCAGVMYFTMMANTHVEQWDRTVDVNCKGLLHCLAAVVPDMLQRRIGHIVAISSDAGRKVFPGLGVYSASKFFVEATLQSLRLETAGTGLRVTSVQPGNTSTDLLAMSTDAEAVKKYGEPTGAQILSPDEVASSILFALKQPEHVSVNEVLIEPRDEPI